MFREILSVVLLCIQAVYATYIAVRIFFTSIFDMTHTSNILVNRVKYEKTPYKVAFFYNPVIFIVRILIYEYFI